MLSGVTMLLLVASFTQAQAVPLPGLLAQGDPFRINFDEKGNGSYQVFNPSTGMYGPVVNDPGVLVADPTSPTGMSLQYATPEAIVTGCCLAVTEPPATSCTASTCSDAVKFLQIGNNFFIRYYSDREVTEAGDLADTGLPSDFFVGATVNEVGPEGNNGFMFDAGGTGNPATDNFYTGVSDVPVPAPLIGHGLLVLLAVGGVLFGAKLLERGRRRSLMGAVIPHAAKSNLFTRRISQVFAFCWSGGSDLVA
jgi:hypothetical protein